MMMRTGACGRKGDSSVPYGSVRLTQVADGAGVAVNAPLAAKAGW